MKIQDLRKAKGLSRPALEKLAGLRDRALESYETGFRSQNQMALETAVKVANVLGCDPRDLIIENEVIKPNKKMES